MKEIKMNFTKTLRNYLENNRGTIFDVSFESKERFTMIPFDSMLVILSRLEKEGLLTKMSKGVYRVNGGEDDEWSLIRKTYISFDKGMVVGYALYNH